MCQTVSIVLPTHNGSRYIREAIDSCLGQSHRDLELIVVDDASKDHTPEILANYRDERLRVLRHQSNLGLPSALNTGFAASRGDFLTWISDDNSYHPRAIETMLAALNANPTVALVYAGMRLIDAQGKFIREVEAAAPAMLGTKNVVGACFLYRRAVYEVLGNYDDSLAGTEDYDYWLRTAARFSMLPITQTLYNYRVHSQSLSSQMTILETARLYDQLHTKHFGPDPGRLKQCLADLYISRAFEDYFTGHYITVAPNVLRALARDFTLLRNRGVYAILVRSLLRRFASAAPTAQV